MSWHAVESTRIIEREPTVLTHPFLVGVTALRLARELVCLLRCQPVLVLSLCVRDWDGSIRDLTVRVIIGNP